MDDKSALLGSLKIDRDAQATETRPPWKWIVVTVAVLLGAVGAWAIFGGEPAVPVQVVAARAVSANGGGASSVLDASGYVVARRQATVSSKVTGKVIEVNVEEGMAVREGQVLARLDDSTLQAALRLYRAQL
ncbi:MAG TPA: biotin/lipoyl-binding protein, partial [Nevskiaceae bacterium]|nr:biotin/lipoyl-binding protein [Nevskiaceae bacterium]